MKGKSRGKEAPKKEHIEENARSNENDGTPTIVEIVHMGAVKSTAVRFASVMGRMFKTDRERAIATWAYACGMAKTLKMTERSLGTFGASTVFGSIAEAIPPTKDEDDGEDQEFRNLRRAEGDEFDRLERLIASSEGKQASGRFDPMYS